MTIRPYAYGEDGPRARVSVTWDLAMEDIAGLIIVNLHPNTHADLKLKRTKAELEESVRTQLFQNAESRNWWSDEYAEDYPGEPTKEEVREWGMEQARRLMS